MIIEIPRLHVYEKYHSGRFYKQYVYMDKNIVTLSLSSINEK